MSDHTPPSQRPSGAKAERRFHLEWSSETHPGRVRSNNEDNHLADSELNLFIVADGMGGHSGGEIASQNAISIIHEALKSEADFISTLTRQSPDEDWNRLQSLTERAINHASERIHTMAAQDTTLHSMGTTLTLVLLLGDRGLMAHVGDSRLYLCRGGQVYQLSEDHTYVWQMLQKGKMSAEEAQFSPFSHLLTRALGMQPKLEVDCLYFECLPGDTFLLCSDGLHNYAKQPNKDLLPHLNTDDIAQSAHQLVQWALELGGDDNITALVIKLPLDDSEERPPQPDEVTLQYTTLQKTALFQYITYEEMLRVLNLIVVEEIQPNKLIVAEGEEGHEIFIMLSGDVEVTRDGQVLRQLGPGAHFGEMALINAAPRSATIRSLTHCRMMVISEEGLFTLMRNEPRIANKIIWGLVEVLSSRLRSNSDLLAAVLAKQNQSGNLDPTD